MILTILILFIYKNKKYVRPISYTYLPGKIVIASFIVSSFITYYVLAHLPIIDFRAYAIGKSISEGMEYKDDGEIPPVHDFMLEDSQNDLAPQILKAEKVMLIIMSDIKKADFKAFPEIKKVADKAIEKGYKVYGASASFTDIIEMTKTQFQLPFEILFCDETTLKTMIRANPGIMICSDHILVS